MRPEAGREMRDAWCVMRDASNKIGSEYVCVDELNKLHGYKGQRRSAPM